MVSFWYLHLVLPKHAIRMVNQICTAVLWKGNFTSARGAKVTQPNVVSQKVKVDWGYYLQKYDHFGWFALIII